MDPRRVLQIEGLTVSCFVIGGDEGDEAYMASLLQTTRQLGFRPTIVPSFEVLGTTREFLEDSRPLVLVPDPLCNCALARAVAAFAQGPEARGFVLYIADTIPPDSYKELVRSRAGDWSTWEALPGELKDFARATSSSDALPLSSAKILSCLPSKGGVGTTTLTVEMAVHLATRDRSSASRIAVLDLNLQGGTLPDLIDLEPRLDLREISHRPERLDEQLIDIFTSRYSPRLDVFASPIRRVDLASADPQIIFAFLDAIAVRYSLVLLDVPHQDLPWIDNVVQGSDGVVVVGGSTVPALKQLRAKLDRLDELSVSPGKIAVAVNGCRTDLFGRVLRRTEIENAFTGRQIFYIRRDEVAVGDAHDAGRSLMETAPSSRVSRDVKRLAAWADAAVQPVQGGAKPRLPARGSARR